MALRLRTRARSLLPLKTLNPFTPHVADHSCFRIRMATAALWSSFCSLSCTPEAASAAVAQAVDLISSSALKQVRRSQNFNRICLTFRIV